MRELTDEQVNKLISAYVSNKEELKEIKQHLREYGILDNGVSDIQDTFEMGYNNALEYVFTVLELEDNENFNEKRIEELRQQIQYEEEKLKCCGYGKSELLYLEELKEELKMLEEDV